jgi:hypothetical protein
VAFEDGSGIVRPLLRRPLVWECPNGIEAGFSHLESHADLME